MAGHAVPLIKRVWKRADQSGGPDACWPWMGVISARGYGLIREGPVGQQRSFKAHRIAYEAINGPIPDGLQIDHLCRNKSCVNPAHMEAVTLQVNVRRAYQALRKERGASEDIDRFCLRGHEYTDENTYLDNKGYRGCRQCRKELAGVSRARRQIHGAPSLPSKDGGLASPVIGRNGGGLIEVS